MTLYSLRLKSSLLDEADEAAAATVGGRVCMRLPICSLSTSLSIAPDMTETSRGTEALGV